MPPRAHAAYQIAFGTLYEALHEAPVRRLLEEAAQLAGDANRFDAALDALADDLLAIATGVTLPRQSVLLLLAWYALILTTGELGAPPVIRLGPGPIWVTLDEQHAEALRRAIGLRQIWVEASDLDAEAWKSAGAMVQSQRRGLGKVFKSPGRKAGIRDPSRKAVALKVAAALASGDSLATVWNTVIVPAGLGSGPYRDKWNRKASQRHYALLDRLRSLGIQLRG